MEDNNSQPEITNKKTNTYWVVGIVIVAVAITMGIVFLRRGSNSLTSSAGQVAAGSTANGPVKEFTVDGTNFAFSPAKITVNKGDTVKIIFRDDDGRHNLIVDGYNVATDVLSGGEQTIQFVADKFGTFEYYCSVANHRDLGMTGTFIVQ